MIGSRSAPLFPTRYAVSHYANLRNERLAGEYRNSDTPPPSASSLTSGCRRPVGGNRISGSKRKAIDDFAGAKGATLHGRFTEVESSKAAARPGLEKALHLARVTGMALVIVRLDRLSHNAAFPLTLEGSGVGFLACDMPEANDLTMGIMALVAQQEREAISRCKKAALAAAKARGVKLGNPNGAEARKRAGKGGEALLATGRCNADSFAMDLALVVDEITALGHTTLRAIAAEMNARSIRTGRGGRWHVSTVSNLFPRKARAARDTA